MTIEEFQQTMPEGEEHLLDVQLSEDTFARIYQDKSVYITDVHFNDWTLTLEEIEKLLEAYKCRILN